MLVCALALAAGAIGGSAPGVSAAPVALSAQAPGVTMAAPAQKVIKGRPPMRGPVRPADTPPCTQLSFGFFCYVAGAVSGVSATGADVHLTQAAPTVDRSDFHSLIELAVESSDSMSIVEVGWIVNANTDGQPHLFVFHWVNGQPTCYNACGFVSTSSTITPGMVVATGSTPQDYKIQHRSSRGRTGWWIGYRGTWFGYFPDGIWNGSFTRTSLVQTFGEVAAAQGFPCGDTQMGDGIFGDEPGAAQITRFRLLGTPSTPPLDVFETSAPLYTSGSVTPTSFTLGGTGSRSC